MNDNKKIVNESMLDLFRAEMETHTHRLDTLIQQLSTDSSLDDIYEKSINTCRAIKGAVKLVRVSLAENLSEKLEEIFIHFKSSSIKIDKLKTNLLLKCSQQLLDISKLDIEELNTPEKSTHRKIQSYLDQLDIYLLENPTKEPSQEIEKEPEKPHFNTSSSIDPAMFDLFTIELQNSLDIISNNILETENSTEEDTLLEAMMRAAHSIKGAARMIGIESVVKVSHSMEDVFVAAQKKHLSLTKNIIDTILQCTDLLKQIEQTSSIEIAEWSKVNSDYIKDLIQHLEKIQNNTSTGTTPPPENKIKATQNTEPRKIQDTQNAISNNTVRVSTERINRLISLAGELTVTTNWIQQYSDDMLTLKRHHNELLDQIDKLRSVIDDSSHSEFQNRLIVDIQHKAEKHRETLTSQIISLDNFDRRASHVSTQINHEIIASRMRPFKECTQGYKRMIRDVSHTLNKKVKLEINGEDTPVDRDILEKLDAPLNHMIRNAMDHGLESPEERLKKGKPETGLITISASHHAGRLHIRVKDDGRGVDTEALRKKILDKGLVNQQMAQKLSKSELLDFLFLPAFSTRNEVTELSGRGVGLDIVHSALQEINGKLHADTQLGSGMEINMELPLTLSVMRCLLISLNNELYAFPLAKIHSIISVKKTNISIIEDKQYINIENQHIGLIHCSQIIGLKYQTDESDEIPLVIIGDYNTLYGVVVDKFIGERGLALRDLNKKLGKVKDISAAALTDEGEPVLIFDIDDLLHSIQDIASGKDLYKVGLTAEFDESELKRVLVVDDSLTVREIEKKLLESKGYLVDVAVDGVDGWNTVRNGSYDLVISDIDMPRMNGFDFISLIKNDAALRNLPVMMVSYKDRPEDKQRGLEVGADYYLTKGSFHDDTLVNAVIDLIGEANN